jgi:hypothetical protein
MPVDQPTFDADLATYNAAVTALIAAIEAFMAIPAVVDLSAEDASVKAGADAVNAEIAKIPVPPGP